MSRRHLVDLRREPIDGIVEPLRPCRRRPRRMTDGDLTAILILIEKRFGEATMVALFRRGEQVGVPVADWIRRRWDVLA